MTSTLQDADLALLFASAGDLAHLETGCSSGSVESEINIQSAGAKEGGRMLDQ